MICRNSAVRLFYLLPGIASYLHSVPRLNRFCHQKIPSSSPKLTFSTIPEYHTCIVIFEVAIESVEGALAAQQGGAQRVEVCTALNTGGITPSYGLISTIRSYTNLDVHVLIRPRGGDFCYSETEFETMLADIQTAKTLNIQGVVTGILKLDGSLDFTRMQTLIRIAYPLKLTFHRAFDICANPETVLEQLIALGVHRLLTSGGEANAWEGRHNIAAYIHHAGGRIIIMPGGGIHEDNIAGIAKHTGANEFHFSASREINSPVKFEKPGVRMGGIDDLTTRRITDPDRIRRMIAIANTYKSQIG